MGGTADQLTVRDVTTELLRELGMTTIFGNPGSTELPMFRDLPNEFRYILCLQESIAMAAADGFAQATRNAALVNLHSAAGVGHALGNLFTAYKNQTPVVVTAGQQARSILPYDPFLFAQAATEFPKPYVKWSIEPARAQDVPAAIQRAYLIAMTPPCGPTFVSIPVDDWDQPCPPIEYRKPLPAPAPAMEVLGLLAEAVERCHWPILIAGAGVAREDGWDDIIAAAERHAAPVFVAPFSSRCSFPEDHPLFAGFLPASKSGIAKMLAGYDLAIVLGGPLSLYHTEAPGSHLPNGLEIFQLVDDPTLAAWSPNGRAAVGAVRPALQFLASQPARNSGHSNSVPPKAQAPEPGVLTDAYLLSRIAALRPPGAPIVEEAPSSRNAMHDHLPITVRDGFYTCASGGLGHGLPASIGIALGRPGEHVVAVLGDGSSMYAIQGLWTAAQLQLPITFIIINNGRYQALADFGRHFGLERPIGIELPELDFVGLARSQGVVAERVTKIEELDDALCFAFESQHPHLIEVIVA